MKQKPKPRQFRHRKLNDEQVREIRKIRKGLTGQRLRPSDPRSYHALAKKYGVSTGAIHRLLTRVTYKEVY